MNSRITAESDKSALPIDNRETRIPYQGRVEAYFFTGFLNEVLLAIPPE
tara:strand:- start:1555 stop:1701 length:147 start_codon:yes stop_codon:yes gene_type:complete